MKNLDGSPQNTLVNTTKEETIVRSRRKKKIDRNLADLAGYGWNRVATTREKKSYWKRLKDLSCAVSPDLAHASGGKVQPEGVLGFWSRGDAGPDNMTVLSDFAQHQRK
ncbi:hypothetical protein HAX54_014186 [Datura stramonium]|uniref:Uncharacterized protein n=1 Tax=Datura stramonium TaxID=4076 RepID=A0ABS8TQD0_DATST|nr:hypothetical protein [Datura stramonium]